jgi:hypothetical protein
MPLAALLLSFLVALQDDLDKRLSQLIAELRSEDIGAREKATKELVNLGVDALPKLEKLHSTSEGEDRSRLGTVVERLRRELLKTSGGPPARLVTVSAKDQPLKSFLEDVGRQSGVACMAEPAVGERKVTIDAKSEPLFRVLDRVCHLRGDLGFEVADGLVRMSAGTPRLRPTAYTSAFRARLMRTALHDANDFAERRTDAVLYFQFDAQPDFKCVSLAATATPDVLPGVASRAVNQNQFALAMWEPGRRFVFLDEKLPIVIEEGEDLFGVYVLKNLPADVRTAPSLKIRATGRFAVSATSRTIPLVDGPLVVNAEKLPFTLERSGHHLFISSLGARRGNDVTARTLQEFVEIDSIVVLDKGGKEIRLENQSTPGRGSKLIWRYQFLAADRDLKDDGLSLRFNLIEIAEREIDFELKDVKLRD